MQKQHAMILACWAAVLTIPSPAPCEAEAPVRADSERNILASNVSTSPPVIQVGLSRVPKLGFRSTFGNVGGATGELIREVQLGSAADRMKLLPGDVIVAVNGAPLVDANSWFNAVHRALARDGWVTLKIRTGRAGAMEYRTVNLLRLPGKR